MRVFDNLSVGRIENLEEVLGSIEFMRGDLRSPEQVREAVDGIDVVYHQAALGSVPWSIAEPAMYHEVNATGTLRIFLAARDAGVKRIVYASSSSVYGGRGEGAQPESQEPLPRSPYAVSKYAGELYGRVAYEVYGLETIGLRYFNVFGPRQNPESEYAAVIPKFILSALRNQALTVHGDGLQTRDFTYVENVVQFNLLAAAAEGVGGEVFNVGCGQKLTLLEMIAALGRLLGKPPELIHVERRAGDVRTSMADISKGERMAGYKPAVLFEEGLRRTVDFFRA